MLMLATCYSDEALMKHIAELAGEDQIYNVQFMAEFMQKNVHGCFSILMNNHQYPEVWLSSYYSNLQAAFFASTYCPEKLEEAMEKWREDMQISA